MHEAGHSLLLQDAVVLLGFALGFVLLFRRIGLGATLGYLVAGALVGPHVLGLVGDAEEKIGFAELGIVFLLFVVGLELNPTRLWRLRHDIFGLGLLQVAACGIALSLFLGLVMPIGWATAFALGLPLGLSSTAQVLPMLQSAGRLRSTFGERAFSILLFQDLSIIPLITVIAALGVQPTGAEGPSGWMLGLNTVIAMIGLVLVGRFLIRPLYRLIGGLGEREMFVVAGLFAVIGAAAVMEWLGLSAALGAFIAGVMLSDTPYRHEIEADIEPFRSILLGLFFLAVGMMLDLQAIADRPVFVVAMALALIAIKALVILPIGLLFGMSWRSALALGLLLSQGGEFGFVLFSQAASGGLISAETSSLFGAIVTLSMVMTPVLMIATRRFRQEPRQKQEAREGPELDGANALVVGYGRFGQSVAQMLIAADIPVTLIDRDVGLIDLAGGFGAKVYFGDGTRLDLLRQAGAGEACLILFCIDGDQVDSHLVESIRKAFPNAALFVRAYDRRTVVKLGGAPADGIVREVLESAVLMARDAMDHIGLGTDRIGLAEEIFRKNDRERLREQVEEGNLTVARDLILTQPARRSRSGETDQ